MQVDIRHFFDTQSSTFTYVVSDPPTGRCAVIDPVLGYDCASGRTNTEAADTLLEDLRDRVLKLIWILETHAHADHLSAAKYLQSQAGGKIGIGEGIRWVQNTFRKTFNLDSGFAPDGTQFDRLFHDDEIFQIGRLDARVMRTPGHTSDSVTYVIGNAAFVGDTLFMPDSGTARCDFPGGDAGVLYDSIQRILSLPDDTQLYICHDYGGGGGRQHMNVTTVGEQKKQNIHVGGGTSREKFIEIRTRRDATLSLPALILPSIQVNIRAGELPPAEDNGVSYLKIPLDAV